MALKDDLQTEVKVIFRDAWEERDGQSVPEPKDLKLGNDAVKLERATVLYADLNGSTALVDDYKWGFAGEIYKTFLHCAAKIIKYKGGTITAYDGDRIMAVFLGNSQTTDAAKCGLHINYAVRDIVNPALKAQYPNSTYSVRHVVGIDTTEIHAARTGVRGDNDIVWIGRAANYAAKLTEIDSNVKTWLTADAYNRTNESSKMGGNPPQNMWTAYRWNEHDNSTIYGSTWYWEL